MLMIVCFILSAPNCPSKSSKIPASEGVGLRARAGTVHTRALFRRWACSPKIFIHRKNIYVQLPCIGPKLGMSQYETVHHAIKWKNTRVTTHTRDTQEKTTRPDEPRTTHKPRPPGREQDHHSGQEPRPPGKDQDHHCWPGTGTTFNCRRADWTFVLLTCSWNLFLRSSFLQDFYFLSLTYDGEWLDRWNEL